MSDKALKEIFDKGLFKGEIKFDQPMSRYTSLKIGGPVEIMVFPKDSTSLRNVLIAASKEKIPVFAFGAGTNLLVKDKGVHGIAVSLKAFKRIEFIQNIERIAPHLSADIKGTVPDLRTEQSGVVESGLSPIQIGLFVEAGVLLNGLINFAKKNGFSGIEALAGIPGTVGGAIYINAGSFGTEIKDVIVSVALMKMDGRIVILTRDELKFSYRSSNIPDDTIILSANIILKRDSPENVSARISEFLKKRRSSQPIGQLSAGCVFKNPVGIDSCREGDSAGRLIEAANCKGIRVGGVEVSNVHANYFINKGKATCGEFLKLMEIVKARVKDHSGITLEPEIKIIGSINEQ